MISFCAGSCRYLGLQPHVNATLGIICVVEHEAFEGCSGHQIHGTVKITVAQLKGCHCRQLLVPQVGQTLHIMQAAAVTVRRR